MWYRGIGITSPSWTVCYATSPDGVHWTRCAENPVLQGQAGSWDAKIWYPRVLVEQDRYSMWYSSTDSGQVGEVGYAYLLVPEQLCGAALVGLALCLLGRRIARNQRSN